VALTSDIFAQNKGFPGLIVEHSLSSLVIVTASLFETSCHSCGKTDTWTNGGETVKTLRPWIVIIIIQVYLLPSNAAFTKRQSCISDFARGVQSHPLLYTSLT